MKGPPISVFGAGNFKTLFMMEVMIKERAIYLAAVKPVDKRLRYVMVNFYEEPTGPFTKEIHICQLTNSFNRWAIMGKPCDKEIGQLYGYKGP